MLADGRAIAIFARRPLYLVLADGRAFAIFALCPQSLVLADGSAIAIFTFRDAPPMMAQGVPVFVALGMMRQAVATIVQLVRMGLGEWLGFVAMRLGLGGWLGFGATRLGLGGWLGFVAKRRAVVFGWLVLISLRHLWHSPYAVDRLAGVVRIWALALTGRRARLVSTDHIAGGVRGLCWCDHFQFNCTYQ